MEPFSNHKGWTRSGIVVRAFDRSWEHSMSRAPLILSAAAVFCVSSLLALADEKRVIASAMENAVNAATQKSAALKQREHAERLYRHYRGYDERPSAMVVPPRPV
jgi:hypothetical protein